MPKQLIVTVVYLLLFAWPAEGATAPSSSAAASQPTAVDRTLIDTYCVTCHNERLNTAGLMLDRASLQDLRDSASLWEKVVRKLRSGTMPPANAPRPNAATLRRFVSTLEQALDRAGTASPDPGRSLIHRLNRTEYTNAVRDLLALEIDGRALLPGDDSSYGFDNIADALTVSPRLLERYLVVAKHVSRMAVGDPTMPPTEQIYTNPYLTLVQDERMSEELPFGSRGGMAVQHHFPLDGEYVLSVHLQRNPPTGSESLRGLADANVLEIRLDGALVRRFDVGGDRARERSLETYDRHEADPDLSVRVPVRAGLHSIGVSFLNTTWYVEGVAPARLPVASQAYAVARDYSSRSGKIETGIDNVRVSGPFEGKRPTDTASRRHIFICQPAREADEASCARSILSRLARRAYRRPVTETETGTLLTFFEQGREGRTFDDGIQSALTRILVDPNFLFRIEVDPPGASPGTVHRISDLELASRLSFFLWSSIPDDELIDLATQQQLSNPAVLAHQVQRMLRDDRARAIVSNFFGQWLYVRNVRTHKPNNITFSEFDDNLRRAFTRETELFLESQLREDRSVLDLLTADFTFLNQRLAEHYGIPGVYGSHFRRVRLPDQRRAGVLGHGSILTVTSYNHRTSPVLRGKWILENLLGTPPPPPPPNVPQLDEDEGGTPTSMRARMERHRRNPVCAACHKLLDPLGFALENFDAVGKWRDMDGADRVDASGALPDGTAFQDVSDFRSALLERSDLFVTNLIEKLLIYGLGRGVEYYDMPAVRAIANKAESDSYRWSSLIVSIVRSVPFQMRRVES